MDKIQISNSKINGNTRKVEVVGLNRQIRAKQIILVVTVWPIDVNGEEINTKEQGPYDVELIADNTRHIDPATGNDVAADFTGAVPEFDFFDALGAQSIKQDDVIKQYILKRDSENRFDV